MTKDKIQEELQEMTFNSQNPEKDNPEEKENPEEKDPLKRKP